MKTLKLLMIAIIGCLILSGCGKQDANRVFVYNTDSDDYFKEFYIEKTEYYDDKVVIYYNSTFKNMDWIQLKTGWEFSEDVIVYKTDNPDVINSFAFSIPGNDADYFFRYLDSEAYACISQQMDSEGGMHISGNTDRYYTDEEKEKQQEHAEQYANNLEEQFLRFEGKWISDDGDYFEFFRDNDNHAVSYRFEGENGTESPVFISDYLYATKNCIKVSYIDGPFENMFEFDLSEDEQSFDYYEKTFYKE